MSAPTDRTPAAERPTVLVVAWIGTLFASLLPAIIWQELFWGDAPDVLWLRLGSLALLVLLSLFWKALAPLRGYWLVLLAILVADELLRPVIARSTVWQGWFGGTAASWFRSSLGTQLLRLLATALAWAVLLILGKKRPDYFLLKGDLAAPAEPVRWLDIKPEQRWTRVGREFAIVLAIVYLVVSFFTYRPTLADVGTLLPLLLAVLLFAALNAFNENFAFRAALLSQLLPVIGKEHSLLLLAAFFGINHFYGMPPGLVGVALTGFLGWLLAKSMVETRGFLWAWLIQFPLDVIVFAFMVMRP